MLAEDRVLGKDFGKDFDELLDRIISHKGAIPDVEQVVLDSRYTITVGTRDGGYIQHLGNSPSAPVISINIHISHSHTKQTRTQTRYWKNRYSSGRRNRVPQQQGGW